MVRLTTLSAMTIVSGPRTGAHGRDTRWALRRPLGGATRTGLPVPAELRVEHVPFTHDDAQLLNEKVQAEYVVRYGTPDQTHMDPGQFESPAGAFYVGYRDGAPVTMGGWRFRPDVSRLGAVRPVEVKRMYVAPAARRGGLARLMLAHLEATARTAGADAVLLETGTAQPEAMALYESSGYERVEPFGYYRKHRSNRCYGRILGAGEV
jgi:GNAT superfamily N-acetyltransferase